MNGILTVQTGSRFSVPAGTNRSLTGGGGDRADLAGSGPVATYGDQSRAQLIHEFFDITRLRFREQKSLEVRRETFNLANKPNFGNPSSGLNSSTLGQITSARDGRIIQIAMKLRY